MQMAEFSFVVGRSIFFATSIISLGFDLYFISAPCPRFIKVRRVLTPLSKRNMSSLFWTYYNSLGNRFKIFPNSGVVRFVFFRRIFNKSMT
jgi:hypothetical protein